MLVEHDTMPGDLDHPKSMSKHPTYRREDKAFQVKDVILVLIFLVGIAAIYTNVNERLVKLETKGEVIAQQLIEMKSDTSRVTGKLDEAIRSLQAQIRDVEQLIVMTKSKP